MVWFKVDDNLAFHAKAVSAGNPAMGLWVRAGSWAAQQVTDGFIPHHIVSVLGTAGQARTLVKVRLWELEEGGYRFHAWTERQPSKADVEAERAAARDRMRAARAKKKGIKQDASSQVSDLRSPEHDPKFGRSSEEVRDVFALPDPTRPDPTHIRDTPADAAPKKEAKKRTPVPAAFKPNDKHREKAKTLNLDVDTEVEKFCDYHLAKGTKNLSWDAAFNNWLRMADEFRSKNAPTPTVSHLRPVEDIEEPPPFLSPEQYEEWRRAKPGRR
ncbi:MAG: hypothetical protein ABWX92_00645 [Mycetocola sp.]